MSKLARQAAIRNLVGQQTILSQEELRRLLRKRGYAVTQATLSRDIHEIGLGKGGRGYFLPNGNDSTASNGAKINLILRSFVTGVSQAQNLLVVRTSSGSAQPVAVALDQEQWPEVVGTIGGDDTVLVVCPSVRLAQRALAMISEQIA